MEKHDVEGSNTRIENLLQENARMKTALQIITKMTSAGNNVSEAIIAAKVGLDLK